MSLQQEGESKVLRSMEEEEEEEEEEEKFRGRIQCIGAASSGHRTHSLAQGSGRQSSGILYLSGPEPRLEI
jgi:hypothetical protein